MPLNRPTLTELITRIDGDVDARLAGIDPRLRRSLTEAIVRAHAGAMHGLYGELDAIALDAIPDTAVGDALIRWATMYGVTGLSGTAATGFGTATGSEGEEIPTGSLLQLGDGTEFVTLGSATISAGEATLALEASSTGSAGNADTGSIVTFISPISGIDLQVTVDAPGLTGGIDADDDEALQASLVARIQNPEQGGNLADFERWTFEAAAGITRRWVFPPQVGSALVGVVFVRDDETPITPDAGEMQEVQDYLDVKRPLGSRPVVVAPTLVPLDVTMSLTPNTAAVQAAVEAELADMILRDAAPSGTILLSHIREAVSLADGETDHNVTIPSADVTHAAGELAVPGSVTFL